MANFKGVPTPLIRTKGIDPKAKSGALRGDICLQLKDALTGKITDEIRGHNMLTNGLESALNGCPFDLNKLDGGNNNRQYGWFYHPLYESLLGGVILFPQTLGNDPDLLFPSFSNMPTGYASCDSYQQGDPKQGAYNAVSSGVITNGFRHVFNWVSSAGNGQIASLGLAPKYCEGWCKDVSIRMKPSPAGDSGYGAFIVQYGMGFAVSEKGILFGAMKGTDDRDSMIGFTSRVRPHNLSIMQDMTSPWVEYDSDGGTYIPYIFSNEHRKGLDWTLRIPYLDNNHNFANRWTRYNFQIIGNFIYVIYHVENTNSITVLKLNIADGTTADETTYTFSANFGNCPAVYWDGYLYCGASTAGTVYKCNCANVADITELTDSAIPANAILRFVGTQFIYNQYFILDASCDVLVANTGRATPNWAEGRAYDDSSWNSTHPLYDDGIWLVSHNADRAGSYLEANIKQWGLMTHFDLQNAVTKTADKQMEVQYSITQV